MSPTPARRKPRRPAGRPTSIDRRPEFDDVSQLTFKMARGLAQAEDPLEAELLASTILGMWHQPLIDVDDPVDFLGQEFVRYVAKRRSADALAMLVGLVSVGRPGIAHAAQVAATQIRSTRISRPDWADRPPTSRFIGAWVSSDEYGDQDILVAEFERDGWRAFCIAALVDHNLGGIAKDVFVSPEASGLRDGWTKRTGIPITELPVQAYVDRMTDALDLALATGHRPYEQDEPDVTAFARARLRDLPPARTIDVAELDEEAHQRLVDAFAASEEGASVGESADLAMNFVSYASATGAGDPLRWSPIAVESCLLDWLPRRVTLDATDQVHVPDVLRAWVRFAGHRRGLPVPAIDGTVAAIGEVEAEYLLAMRDRTRYGPAKSLVTAMLAEGVPLTDQASLDAWLADFNARPLAERDRILGTTGIPPDYPDWPEWQPSVRGRTAAGRLDDTSQR